MQTETRLLVADDWEDYALLDSGHLQKLERFGSQTVIRPDPQAFWNPARPVQSWKADARFAAKGPDEDGAGQCHQRPQAKAPGRTFAEHRDGEQGHDNRRERAHQTGIDDAGAFDGAEE